MKSQLENQKTLAESNQILTTTLHEAYIVNNNIPQPVLIFEERSNHLMGPDQNLEQEVESLNFKEFIETLELEEKDNTGEQSLFCRILPEREMASQSFSWNAKEGSCNNIASANPTLESKEPFLKILEESYNNLLNMFGKEPSEGNCKEPQVDEELRRETEKFLKESFDNLLNQGSKGRRKQKRKRIAKSRGSKSQKVAESDNKLVDAAVTYQEGL